MSDMLKKRRILVADDDRQVLRDVQGHLEGRGYEVTTSEDGLDVVRLAEKVTPDLIVLDINFPGPPGQRSVDGFEVLQSLRQRGNVPVLILSATNVSAMKVMALSIGADDYVPKPCDLDELGARVDAILRRAGDLHHLESVLEFARLRLDPGERRVWKDGEVVDLTAIEFKILHTLARRPQHVFSRDRLLALVWKESHVSMPKVIDVHVGHIRRKLEDDPANPIFIETVRGSGYRFSGG